MYNYRGVRELRELVVGVGVGVLILRLVFGGLLV